MTFIDGHSINLFLCFKILSLIPTYFVYYVIAGHRANEKSETIEPRGIMGRMLGAVSNGVKIGTFVLDSVQQRTNDVIQNALH